MLRVTSDCDPLEIAREIKMHTEEAGHRWSGVMPSSLTVYKTNMLYEIKQQPSKCDIFCFLK